MYFLYSLLTAAALALLLPYFFLKGLRTGKYLHNLRERLGYLPESFPRNRSGRGAIWIHAVSVGEALAGLPLARRLKEKYPDRLLYVSTTTFTGQNLARERMDFADGFLYFPMDWRGAIRRVMDALKPAMVVILETEIWPNFLRECKAAGIPVVFVNGRISQASYSRYRFAGGLMRRVLKNADLYMMQSPDDALRIGTLGAPAEKVMLGGNLKYDLSPPATSPFADWLEQQVLTQNRRPLAVAGSVVENEEKEVIEGFWNVKQQWPSALLVLAPRKPERFDAATRIASDAEWELRGVVRRSRLDLNKALDANADVVVLDTIGELAVLYRIADVTFVGGSLVSVGGHNILEPAGFGKVPCFGPSMSNFAEMAATFLDNEAAIQVETGELLGAAWLTLLKDSEKRERIGAAARKIVEANRGATDRAFEKISAILDARGNGA